ncbi:MAG: iron-sulfur cluster carrier protein ApbC [Hahellaceae bacterium]|nr:iron-sulfur cluster carrier protein ApbC [Hahellaceae bacterium]
MISQSAVEAAIRSYQDPYLNQDLLALGAVKEVRIEGAAVHISLRLAYPSKGLQGALRELLVNAIEDVEGVESVVIDVAQQIQPHGGQNQIPALPGVKNVIAVASGKGGVGKSTVTVNLALALQREGARVGILDADIYGPSQGMMLGVAEGVRPGVKDEKLFIPIEAHGLQVMSMAFLVTEKTPMVWRGPMVSGALLQMANQSIWNDLDYLLIDMPPGTGDIQLTLAQKIPVAGAVIVTTPQDIALLDCRKGIEMFSKVSIPVLGIVENMSVHICSHCGHAEPIFGEDGGASIAGEYQVPLLGQVPLHRTIREQTDGGLPSVAAEPDSEVSRRFSDMARHLGALLSLRQADQAQLFPNLIGKG